MAKRKTSLGCLFWIALILLVLVVFFFNRERIIHVMEETGFSEYLSTDDEKKPVVNRKTVDETDQPEEPSAQQEDSSGEEESQKTESDEADKIEIEEDGESEVLEIRIEDEEGGEETEKKDEKPQIEQKLRKSTLYFVSVADSGEISLRQIVRPIYYTDSPLTTTLETLLEGLTPEELNQGLLNLVPENTQIHSVRVENSTAYIDFSEDLRFNPFGTEGIKAALRQIVYTATEFSTVDRVQILINGDRISYLSMEGINIGDPLSRSDISG